MKKELMIAAILLANCIASFGQQSNDTSGTPDNEVEELTQKVSSLEHELKFLGLSYDLYRLNTDISLFADRTRITSNEVKSLINGNDHSYSLYKSYKDNYDVSMQRLKAFESLMASVKFKYEAFCSKFPFSEVELNNLKESWKSVETGFNYLQTSMDMYKFCIDFYEKNLE